MAMKWLHLSVHNNNDAQRAVFDLSKVVGSVKVRGREPIGR